MGNKIHEIKKYRPHHTERFLVDTNVWYWYTYCASKEITIKARRYQLDDYPEFIEKVLDVGAKIFHSPLTFCELANVIENTEFERFKIENSDQSVSRKEFRNISACRKKVVEEIDVAWKSVSSVSTSLNFSITEQVVLGAKGFFESAEIDPYDTLSICFMKEFNISKIITDDRDFHQIEIGEIYTSNRRILNNRG